MDINIEIPQEIVSARDIIDRCIQELNMEVSKAREIHGLRVYFLTKESPANTFVISANYSVKSKGISVGI